MLKKLFCLTFFLVATVHSTVSADIVFNVQSSNGTSFEPGDTGTLTFILDVTGDDIGVLSNGYQFTATAEGFGGVVSSDFAFIANPTPASDFGTNVPAIMPNTVMVGGTQLGPLLGQPPVGLTSVTQLFTVDYAILPTASASGFFDIDINQPNDAIPTRVTDASGDTIASSFIASPELRLSGAAVPEPSSLTLCIGTCGLLMLRRRKSAA